MKKPNITRKDILLFVMQATAWALVLLLPALAVLLVTQNWENTTTTFWMLFYMLRAPMVVYFANYYLLEPHLWYKKRRWQFVLCNVLLILLANFWLFLIDFSMFPMHSEMAYIGYFMGMFIYLLFHAALIAMTIGLRHYIRSRRLKEELKEQQQKHTEAELAWLKNQINPHFLFNTLNNISSLIQIDADAAQDSIAKLSDLLRYAMYETNKPLVPLSGEIEFMQNYIDLMRLRHNDKLELATEWVTPSPSTLLLPPLLFISLIENAFKHGMNSNAPATIDICLEQQDDTLIFLCDNTNNPKPTKDRSGSGIGLENTRRRLDLLYPGRYTWEQTITPENIYHVKITIRL